MSETWAFRLAVVSAAAMLVAGAFMGVAAPPCHPLPASPMISFELVRSLEDLQRIFGMPGDACRVAIAADLDRANVIDTFAYIPAYAAFFAFVFHALGRRDRLFGWIGVGLIAVCAAADIVENIAMFQLSAAPDVASVWLPTLIVSTNFKWIGLAVATTLAGVMLVRRGGFGWLVLLLCGAPLATSLWAMFAPDAAGQWLIPGVAVASVRLLIVAAIGSMRPAASSR